MVAPNGIITTRAGNGAYGFSGDGGPATSAALSERSSVLVDTAGNLYIGDYGNRTATSASKGTPAKHAAASRRLHIWAIARE